MSESLSWVTILSMVRVLTGTYQSCETCLKSFYVKRYKKNARFCSKPCRNVRVLVSCTLCKKELHIVPSRLGTFKYCSYSCLGKATLPGNTSRMAGKKHSQETREKIRAANTGYKHTPEAIKKMSLATRGKNTGASNHMWKGGATQGNQKIRASVEYKDWRKAVFIRDDYTCQVCKVRGVELNADHIKRFAEYPELRFELSNGRTLCVPCHRDTPTFGTKGMVGFKSKNTLYV